MKSKCDMVRIQEVSYLNERLAALRKKLGYTTRTFAEKLNLSAGAITNMEKGTRNITERTISDICREFNINEHWFRTGEGNMFQDNDKSILGELTTKFHLDNLDIKILEAYLKLPSQQRAVIKHFIAGIAAETVADPIQLELDAYRNELEAEHEAQTSSVFDECAEDSKMA